jgi:riboflavin kinase/FMN adenylyltransferase|tara:strand:+ start:393 stop:758 length:366 start_codon:yes stop_codon:yes gene_type:complete
MFKSKVIHGNKHGADIGYPTANLEVNDALKRALDKYGVYAVKVHVGDKIYKGALFWGKRSLFSDPDLVCEVLIIDFNENVYNKELDIDVVSFMRNIIQVSDESELKQLIKNDIEKVKNSIQ